MWITEAHIGGYRDAIYLMKLRFFLNQYKQSLEDEYSSKLRLQLCN